MLLNLHVKNLAIIQEVEVDFSDQLNVLTGETGAGKSIIIGSINLALGAKAGKDVIRTGANDALVELVFQVDTQEQRRYLEELGVSIEDDQVLISRKLMPKRSICRVNGETVTQSVLREIAGVLIDIHGQHEQQSLLQIQKHMEILDRYAKEELVDLMDEYKTHLITYHSIKAELLAEQIPEEERLREIGFLEFEYNEILEANLREGEEEELEEDYRRLSHASSIAEGLGEIHSITSSGAAAASDQIGECLRILLRLSDYDDQMQIFADQIGEIDDLLTDFNRDMTSYMDEFTVDPQKLMETESRLDLIRNLQSKYGKTIADIQQYASHIEEKLARYREYDQYQAELNQKLSEEKQILSELAEKMTEVRKNKAHILQDKIREALVDLNFLQVQFEIQVRQVEEFTSKGLDEIEFMLSTNPGEPLRAIGAAASGGELSRIMLAIKAVLAEHDEISTLIFDEIDVGISGRTAQKVAEKMALIGNNHQVICISHLAQIAAMADTHYLIEKQNNSERTTTDIYPITREQSVEELARILGGAKITEAVIESAQEMKELADSQKQQIRKQ